VLGDPAGAFVEVLFLAVVGGGGVRQELDDDVGVLAFLSQTTQRFRMRVATSKMNIRSGALKSFFRACVALKY